MFGREQEVDVFVLQSRAAPTILVSMMHGVVAGVASLAPTIERDTVGANDVVGVRFTAPAVMVTK